jgi:glycosyltransferase involved in cell wall biosynthesis
MERGPLVLISGKDPLGGVGGHQSYIRAHALAAMRAGYEPHIFCVAGRSCITPAEFGVVHRVGSPLLPEPPAATHGPLLAHAVAHLLGCRSGPHVIHGFAIWAAAGVIASRSLARRGLRAVPVASAYGTRAHELSAMQSGLGPHHGLVNRLHYRAWVRWVRTVDDPLEGWGYSRSRLVLVNYESVRTILTRAYGDSLRIRRIPYTVPEALLGSDPVPERSDVAHGLRERDPRASVPASIARLRPADAPLVLGVSRHDPRKGVDVLLIALARLAQRGVPFRACVVGPGRLLEAHRRLAAELRLEGRVTIEGRVEELAPYYAAADVFVLPSLAEASGSVAIIEALRAGLAVIASACDGIPEDLEDGVDALLITPGDPAALATAVAAVLTDSTQRARLAARARACYERRFSPERFVSALANVYEEVGSFDERIA